MSAPLPRLPGADILTSAATVVALPQTPVARVILPETWA